MSLLELTYPAAEIDLKRTRLAKQFLSLSPHLSEKCLANLSESDLKLLLDLYNQKFFEKMWEQEVQTELSFSLSTRMTRSAGKTITKHKKVGVGVVKTGFEIRIGINFFLQFDAVNRTKTVCGLPAPSALWALLLVFEHELCHVIESVYFQKSDCGNKRFKLLSQRLFGHTSSYHALPTTREIVYHQQGLQIGDKVTFSHKKEQHSGILTAINKRATVMVPDARGRYVDKDGVHYTKFYVNLNLLRGF